MDDLWCSLDIAGLQSALAADPLWQPFPDSAAVSSIGAGDSNAYFGVADVDLMLSSPDEASNVMATDMDTTGFFGDDDGGRFLFQQHSSTSSSLSSKRSLSIDSGGSSPYQAPAPAAMAHHPSFPGGDQDDEAIMRAMMAVMSASASPSSSASPSASSRPPHPFRRDDGSGSVHQGQAQAAAMALPQQLRGGNGGHVMVKSSLAMSPPEKTQEDPRAAGGNSGQQLYHMMSERKRREKLNDSFLTLRSLLPPCSKKDKTTVLTKAAGYLKALEAQVWELEEKKGKLERHIPASQEAAPAAPQQSRRAEVQISRSEEDVVNLTVMVMVECDVVELVLRVLECLRWMERVSVLSVDADTYSPKVLLKAVASIKLRIMDGCDWNEASFREAMTKAVNDATSSPPTTTTTTTTSLPPCARVPLVVTA